MSHEHSDLDRQIEQLKKCDIIKESEVKALCAKAREILSEESNIQLVDSPVTVSYGIILSIYSICSLKKHLNLLLLLKNYYEILSFKLTYYNE